MEFSHTGGGDKDELETNIRAAVTAGYTPYVIAHSAGGGTGINLAYKNIPGVGAIHLLDPVDFDRLKRRGDGSYDALPEGSNVWVHIPSIQKRNKQTYIDWGISPEEAKADVYGNFNPYAVYDRLPGSKLMKYNDVHSMRSTGLRMPGRLEDAQNWDVYTTLDNIHNTSNPEISGYREGLKTKAKNWMKEKYTKSKAFWGKK